MTIGLALLIDEKLYVYFFSISVNQENSLKAVQVGETMHCTSWIMVEKVGSLLAVDNIHLIKKNTSYFYYMPYFFYYTRCPPKNSNAVRYFAGRTFFEKIFLF